MFAKGWVCGCAQQRPDGMKGILEDSLPLTEAHFATELLKQ